ncbi:MAG: transcription-repair coupling factor [Candidatus Latescibacteria bacterium]|nr:transcription-repair coupling factor [Candidatus Latescibacterota bacterium]NIM22640.1 transcription-repair coupling factor [Candidatus Latescibacterota bacterium]NIM64929.1 transcription-repair coupling factor [Candidatus Latescibacterota bacterium]NIO01444.1 transcription-repair coupling factor [Candidatus Latescibacterota bacterium]NIO27954.1 transcription-repair coupling factor [Candidatus Latescibacterota bacterium]
MAETQNDSSIWGASTLISHVRRSPHVSEVIRGLASGEKRVHLTGLRGSSIVFLIEAMRNALQKAVVICCPYEERARDVLSDFRTISGARSLLFPEKDIFPRRHETGENLSVRGERNYCLDKILQSEVEIVVTSILGFLEKTYPVDVLRTHRRTIHLGSAIDLDDLREQLVELGYEHNPVVEEVGQFAVRGAIIDLFDPSWEHPARIELLDDEVISIRTFDIDSQISTGDLDTVTVLPATGIPSDRISIEALRDRLEHLPVDGENIERIISEITHTRHSHLLQKYAPALGMNGALLDFFEKPPVLVFLDIEALNPSLEAIEKEMEFLSKRPGDGFPPLKLNEYLHPPDYYEAGSPCSVYSWELPVEGDIAGDADKPAFTQIRHGEAVVHFSTNSHPSIIGKADALSKAIRGLSSKGLSTYIYSESAAQRERLADMLDEDEALVHLPVGWITSGFLWDEAAMAVLTDHEIFNRILPRPRKPLKRRRFKGLQYEQLRLGDFVVHVDYGIGRFMGLEKVQVEGRETECLVLRYLGADRIFVPLDQMHLVEKYVGKEGIVPAIDRLGSTRWQRTKERTKRALEDVARELLNIYAAREIVEGHTFSADTQWQKELEAAFPFEETPHQLEATIDVKREMETVTPMDRLICGDVGYGKTEVAIRAAFKAVNDGKQVAVLVPTTILAMQHFKTFRERMEAFPVRVEMLSRFKSPTEQKKIVAHLAQGVVDVVIGTHRLLSKDVAFKDLGLVVVDEEHRFGVRSKEKLKQIKRSVDVLSLTATPIPRTLYMALSGLRQISVIDTPPRNRHPVKTEVVSFDEETIARAIMDEIGRGGQVFFVHNRVASIHPMQAFLEKLVPGVRFGVAHGQMKERELEGVILSFLERKFDVLVSTMIIESGLDFENVDTIIINRADKFGLAQLYQLRGRVGRRERQAYAYLLLPRYFSLSENARKRLRAMEEFEELGSGYRLAMRDLEIRGAGNVLGLEQHGHLVAVGFDLYCKMLKEAVEKLQGKTETTPPQCRIEATIRSFLPDWYVEDQDERMALYRRLAGCGTLDELDAIQAEIKDRFGDFPREALNLLDLTRAKLHATEIGIERIRLGSGEVVLDFLKNRHLSAQQCSQLAETFQGRVLFKSGKAFSVTIYGGMEDDDPALESEHALAAVKKLLKLAYDFDKKGISPARR